MAKEKAKETENKETKIFKSEHKGKSIEKKDINKRVKDEAENSEEKETKASKSERKQKPFQKKTNDRTINKSVKGNNESGTKTNVCLIVTSLIVLSLAVLIFKVYSALTVVPSMPDLDLDEWWSPHNNRQVHDKSIRPFRIVFSEAMQLDLSNRFENYRRLDQPKTFKDAGWTYGVNSEGFSQFFNYWVFDYNFRHRERFLNQHNHFKTNIQGLDIHFMHVKPKVDEKIKVLPLLLLHGWPGSFREFYEVIPLLTTPRPGHDFVFELIVPSLPGFGYSQASVRPGLSHSKVAIIMRNLMQRLGFDYFYIQGGDFGHIVGSSMATIFPAEVIGFHTNMLIARSTASTLVWMLGGLCSGLESLVEKDFRDRLYPLKEKLALYLEESGYYHMQATKPDTLGIALTESPAGLAGYILEKFVIATNPQGKFTEDGGLENVFSKDVLLDNIMIYWATGSITTSMRLYKEQFNNLELESAITVIPTTVPTWGLRLKHEIFFMPEFLLRWKYPNLIGTTNFEEGGHFAALQKPSWLADDVFKAVTRFQDFFSKR